MWRRGVLLAGLLALAAAESLLPGCGYVLGIPRPPGIRTVRLELADNRTNRRDAELLLTQALGPELEAAGFTPVLSDADAVLHVRLVDAVERTVSADALDRPREGTLTLAADVVLRRADGTVAVSRRGIRETDTFVASRGEDEDDALRGALAVLARRIAESLQGDF
ncbi:MAG: LPS assembly lipoprotein LptE [Planctomycetota bacterium]|jgi:outer membrane lipopolysaccharide assembly protein LptE/RlpB